MAPTFLNVVSFLKRVAFNKECEKIAYELVLQLPAKRRSDAAGLLNVLAGSSSGRYLETIGSCPAMLECVAHFLSSKATITQQRRALDLLVRLVFNRDHQLKMIIEVPKLVERVVLLFSMSLENNIRTLALISFVLLSAAEENKVRLASSPGTLAALSSLLRIDCPEEVLSLGILSIAVLATTDKNSDRLLQCQELGAGLELIYREDERIVVRNLAATARDYIMYLKRGEIDNNSTREIQNALHQLQNYLLMSYNK